MSERTVLVDVGPDHWEYVDEDDDSRPGRPLHPGTETVVNSGSHSLDTGDRIMVWIEEFVDEAIVRGTYTFRLELTVIDGDDGDVIAAPSDQDVGEIDDLYRISGDLRQLWIADVRQIPSYDSDNGELVIKRDVGKRQGSIRLLEARSLDESAGWAR